MLSIKEIFDICKEHGVFVDLSYLQTDFDYKCYMIKLYYGRHRYGVHKPIKCIKEEKE